CARLRIYSNYVDFW
nr:immunoglobulin heavy chain junction region [Macaca mulatta]MOW20284.1 immunoglobulin heavy chain junction region [Macaca mulatta]MOW20510.1 immunoglobulin heavy chain junction region [Macaca mulatta]MOW20614.1 immunoglobulin heavy chain junction region [Macaca mulatta]MOW21036.1 immunoglobulin heavy chain junction region [Macaca mulatta]